MRFENWAHYNGITCASDRWDATVSVHRRDGGNSKLVHVTLTRLPNREQDIVMVRWHREPPHSGHKISRGWWAVDRDGGRWRIELGHDGRMWMLFGPCGDPFGYRLETRVDEALGEASMWIATALWPLGDVTADCSAGA